VTSVTVRSVIFFTGAEMKTKSLIKNMFFLKKNEASQFLGQTRNKRGLHEECVNEGCTLEEVLEVHEWMRKLPVPAGVRLSAL